MFFIDTHAGLPSHRALLFISCLLVANFFMADAFAQVPSQSESDDPTLVQRLTQGKKDIASANMDIQFASSGAGEFTDWSLDEFSFNVDRVRLDINGKFGDRFSYNFRQSFNKYTNMNVPVDNLKGNLELANVGWQVNDWFHLTVGKQATQFSGYEYWVNAIQVRDYSDFCSTLPAYMTGMNMAFALNQTQTINLQLVNSRLGGLTDDFAHTLPEATEDTKLPVLATANWDGNFIDNALKLRYSLTFGQQAKNKNVFYFTSGHVWKKKPILAYVDFMFSRQALDYKGYISECTSTSGETHTLQHVDYFTTIANIDYRLSKHWNVYAKGTYEQGNIYRSDDEVQAGTYRKVWDMQLCAEYFPMPKKDLLLYLHLMYKHAHLTDRAKAWGADGYNQQRISFGLVYTLPVF